MKTQYNTIAISVAEAGTQFKDVEVGDTFYFGTDTTVSPNILLPDGEVLHFPGLNRTPAEQHNELALVAIAPSAKLNVYV